MSTESKLEWLIALTGDPKPESVAETHGVVSGLLCARPGQSDTEVCTQLKAMQLGDWSEDAVREPAGPALAELRAELASPRMRFSPLLPTDERALAERTRCLAFWCTGFLAGFGAGEPRLESDEAREALQDLQRIAQAFSDADADPEEEEQAYAEVTEFVRVAVLMLREESV